MDTTKKILLPAPAKTTSKEESKTFVFRLKLGESNDETYPEFSWKELVQERELKNNKMSKIAKGQSVLDPYASDDEDALKAMAAKFEKKYANPPNKHKRKPEDYIDKGAGYDETDSFIDNTDIYDEIVPQDLQTKFGGFYINSGSLEYKEVEVMEDGGDDEESEGGKLESSPRKSPAASSSPPKPKHNSADNSDKITNVINAVVLPGKGRPKNIVSVDGVSATTAKKRKDSANANSDPVKKRRKSSTDLSMPKKIKNLPTTGNAITTINPIKPKPNNSNSKPEPVKEKEADVVTLTSSSSSSGSSDDDDSSSSSSSGSGTESSEDDVSKKNKITAAIFKSAAVNPNNSNAPKPQPPQRRLKVKNVPLNPKLHGGLTPPTACSTPISLTPPGPPPLSNRDIFTSSANSSMKGLNASALPAGLTVTANIGPPKISPSVTGSPLGQQHSELKIPPIKRARVTANTKASIYNIPSTASPPILKKPRKPKATLQQQKQKQIQDAVNNLNIISAVQQEKMAKMGNSATLAFHNYQMQEVAASYLLSAGLPCPFLPPSEVGKKKQAKNPKTAAVLNKKSMNKLKMTPPPVLTGSLSKLTGGLTMTDFRERSGSSKPSSANSSFNKTINVSSSSSNNSPLNSSRLSNSITITPSTLPVNLSSSNNVNASPNSSHHSRNAPLNLTPSSSKQQFKQITPHDVNSLLKKDSPSSSMNPLMMPPAMEKLYGSLRGIANNGGLMGKDAKELQRK